MFRLFRVLQTNQKIPNETLILITVRIYKYKYTNKKCHACFVLVNVMNSDDLTLKSAKTFVNLKPPKMNYHLFISVKSYKCVTD